MNEIEIIHSAVKLKMEYLKNKFNLLGLDNRITEPINPDNGYHVLGRVGSLLERYENPVKTARLQQDQSERILGEFSQNIETEKTFMENQEELVARIRSIYPDFALHMKDKVSKEDYETYTKVVKQTGELIRDLTVGSKERDLTKISKLEEQDIISELIDSREFAKACNIEDTFMTKEYENFRKIVKEKGFEDEAVRNTTPCVILAELVREAEAIERKKEKYMSNFEKYDKFIEGLNDTIEIRKKITYKKEGRDDRDEK